jgi:subtilisin family serine protease
VIAVLGSGHLALAQDTDERTLLLLSRFRFDPRAGEPAIPAEQRTAYAPGQQGFYLVQFVGPVRDEWLDDLRAAGVAFIQYQASFAYIVRMPPELVPVAQGRPFVRAVVVYHAAYRISPSLLQRTQPPVEIGRARAQRFQAAALIDNVEAVVYDDGRLDETLAEIKHLGGVVVQQFPSGPTSSFVTVIFAAPPPSVTPIAQLPAVLWMNYSSPVPGLDDEVSDQIVSGNHVAGVPFTGYNAWLGTSGVTGAGVLAAVVDSGMDTNNNATAHLDIRGRIAAFVPYAGAAATDTDGHGTHVGGVVAGNAANGTTDAGGFLYGLGVAPGAQLVVQNALLGSAWPPAGGWQTLSRDSVVNGAVTSNNSWFTGAAGAQGYSAVARTHDIMVRDADFGTPGAAEPLIMVFSAGNAGPGASTLTEPKEAKNLITVGAAENLRSDPWVSGGACGNPTNINAMGNFSSRGPSMDGRLLPNVTAPGTFISSLRSATGSFGGLSCSGTIDANYVWFSGTSQAAPHVTGGVALITEWWRGFNGGANPSPAMAKALLINGAVDMDTADIPNNNEGWGRMELNNVLNPPVEVVYQDQTTTFAASGDSWSILVVPADPTRPLKVTVVWSDAPGPGSGGATASWVNDLDLTLTQGGTTFRGNVFASGWSTAGGAADTRNNIENVFIQSPSGSYQLTVAASNIAGDGVPLNGDTTDQDFALVCFNCHVNQPPVADAGPDQAVECAAPTGTQVTLDGTGSSDPDGDPLTYAWTGPFGAAAGPTPTVNLPLGVHVVTLTVSDPHGATSVDTVTITVSDTTPPDIASVTANPGSLWPPNHRMVPVTLGVSVTDACDGTALCQIASVASNEPVNGRGDGNTAPDWMVTGDLSVDLRAERSGRRGGRVYTITVQCADGSGNTSSEAAAVVVAHDQR